MSYMPVLKELQKNYMLMEENSRIIKDGSPMYLLSKMKKSFELLQESFRKTCNELELVREKIKETSRVLEGEKKYLELKESKVHRAEDSIEETKRNLKNLEELGAELLEREEKLLYDKDILNKQLVELRNNFYDIKEKSNNKLVDAKNSYSIGQNRVRELEKLLSKDIYERFMYLIREQGAALSKVQGGVCGACKLKLCKNTIKVLENEGDAPVYCPQCGRMLYLEEVQEDSPEF